MITDQELLTKWRELPVEKQQEVLDFVEFLYLKTATSQELNHANKFHLAERLRQLRGKIVASGQPLLNKDEIQQEIASRRGGLQITEE